MKYKEKTAKIIRIVTVPPVLASAMLLIGYWIYRETFTTIPILILNIFLLAIVPVAAYPIASIKRDKTIKLREQQRKLAFGLTFCGYAAALFIGIVLHYKKLLLMVLGAYFIAVFFLTVLNKFLKIRASGHACSCVLPYLFISYWLGAPAAGVCIILYMLEFWASVSLKRHTINEFLAGSLTAATAFLYLISLQ